MLQVAPAHFAGFRLEYVMTGALKKSDHVAASQGFIFDNEYITGHNRVGGYLADLILNGA